LDATSSKAPISDLLRSAPPTHFGPRAISKIDDFLEGVADYPQENILRYYLEDDSRVIVRPSGTEPKLKIYLDTTGATHLLAQQALTELERDIKALLISMA
jgi:phosphomannomutase